MSGIANRLIWKGWLAIALAVVLIVLIAMQIRGRLSVPPVAAIKPLVVHVYEATPRNIQITRTYNATIRDNDRVVIASRIASTVSDILVREGQVVKAGDVIAELDKQDIMAELERAKAQVRQVDADVRFYQGQIEIDKKLYSEGAISEMTLDDSKRKLVGLQASLSQQKNSLIIAKQKLLYATIMAPIDGVVQRLYLNEGEQALTGKPVAEIVGAKNYKAVMAVPEKDMPGIKLHAETIVQYMNGNSIRGKVDRIYPALDDRTHTGTIEIYLAKGSFEQLFPGSIVKAKVVLLNKEGALAVPAHAVVSRQEKKGVYVEVNGKAEWREVKTGESTENETIVEAGIKVGERVIVTPYPALNNGVSVMTAGPSQ